MSNKYEALLNAMDEGYFLAEVIFDRQGKPFDLLHLEANPAAVRMAGAEIVGRRAREIDPGLEQHWYELFARVAKTGVGERHELSAAGYKSVYAIYAFTVGEPDGRTVAAIYRDITKRKNEEEALRKSEEAFSTIAHASPAFIWVGNAAGENLFMSDSWYAYSGLTEEETKNDGWARSLYPGDFETMIAAWNKSRGTGAPYEGELRYRRKDGQYRWHQFRALPRRDADGVIEAWYGISIDIHDRKMAEEELRNREAELARAHRIGGIASIDISVTDDIEDSMSWRSLEYRELHGLLQGIVYETHSDWLRRVHPSDRRKAEQTLKSALAGMDKTYQSEYRIIRPVDGQVRWIYAKMDIGRDGSGKAVRLQGAHIDITDRKRAERAAQKAEEKYRLGLEHEVRLRTAELKEQAHFIENVTTTMPELISVTEVSSKKLVYFNRDPFEMNGYTLEEVMRMPGEQRNDILVYPEDAPLLSDYYQKLEALPDNSTVTVEYRSRKKNGELFWFRVRGKVFSRDKNGRPARLLHIGYDVTAVKESERKIREDEQLFRAVINAPNLGIAVYRAVYDDAGHIIDFIHEFINKRTRLTLGKDMEGKLLTDHGEIGATQLEDFREVMRTGHPSVYIKHAGSNEDDPWFMLSNARIDDHRLVHVWEDVSGLKKAELSIKKQEHMVRRITETMPDMVTIMEWPSRRITYTNRNPYGELGFEPGEIAKMQQERKRFIFSDDLIALEYYYSRFASLPDGQVLTADYRAMGKSGNWMWFRVRGKVFQRDANGGVSHIINVIQNITALKQAETESLESKKKLEAAFDVSVTFLSVLKALRNKEGRIRAFSYEWGNEAANKIAGSHSKRLRLLSAFPISSRKALFAALVSTADTGEAAEFEDKYHIDEHDLWFRWKIVKYDDGVLVSIEDITEKRNAEQEMMKLKLEQQREVLSAIIMTEEKERERIGEALHNGVAQLLYAVQTRLQLVTANSERGQKHLKDAIGITGEAIKDARRISFELVPAVLKDYGIEVALITMIKKIVVSPLHIGLQVKGLQGRLPEKLEFAIYRIVQELVNNIIKHAQADEASVNIGADGQSIGLIVTDNGTGFNEAELSHARHGIGLQSVKNRVNLLDGFFSIRSGSVGTEVRIVLPL